MLSVQVSSKQKFNACLLIRWGEIQEGDPHDPQPHHAVQHEDKLKYITHKKQKLTFKNYFKQGCQYARDKYNAGPVWRIKPVQ